MHSTAILSALFCCLPQASPSTVTSVDLYGVTQVSVEIRAAAGIAVGEELREPQAIEERLRAQPGIADARVAAVLSPGKFALFIGIREQGKPATEFRAAPTEDLRLSPEITAAVARRSGLLLDAIRAGQVGEDRSLGHALSEYEPLRAIDLEYVALANRHFAALAASLRSSRHSSERVAAAEVVAYANDKTRVIPLLQVAARDADPKVRNNAVRALGILAAYAQAHPELELEVDPAPFLALLGSLEWTDRNKGAAALDTLSKARDEPLLARLRSERFAEILEMARWQSRAHATFSIRILARLAGLSEAELAEGLQTPTTPEEHAAWIDELAQSASDD